MAVPAQAQVGYPPGPCTATVNASAAGTVAVGAVLTITLAPVCAWAPGSLVTVTVNGQVVLTKPSGLNGAVTVSVTAVSASTLSIDDPVLVPAICGTNTVTGTGTSPTASAPATQTVTFGLNCASVVSQTGSRGLLSFTGANLLRWTGIALGLVLVGALVLVPSRKRAKVAGADSVGPRRR